MSEVQGVPYSRQEALRTLLRQIIVDMGLDIRVKIRETEGMMRGILAGPDAGLMKRRGGEALRGMQQVVEAVLARDPHFELEAVIEVEGMLESQEEALHERARAAAAEVRRSGQAVHFAPLNPFERRIVHMALKDEADLRTWSEGEGSERRLFVGPADAVVGEQVPADPGVGEQDPAAAVVGEQDPAAAEPEGVGPSDEEE
jgi:spoIIIJ-associated protein